ncbi:Mbov_0401 family ICE element transposase-like protein [Spiroplasma citri]|uniref:ISLre2 family transposase n=1 Tax=Spiroplasma citri TaxID=2133 RepID=A0AAJ4EI45_SPICI|nr:UPF0236 family protein [Spiroplasma citri]APE74112.1 hypothetical protein SCITRI_00198 [Spiroplasma citri]QED24096.1 hypothetical protein FRX96_00860 [Spiroplasma citri]QIA66376.1 hypothetical protein GMI18_00940 [Spiroplasma citri]QIA68252.1 hypothetical protein GL298_01055 [Spiroplasma citri]QIA70127.1 hypothetical protein GL981_01060 [Spiroplasma citri]
MNINNIINGENFFNKTYEDLNRYAVGEIAYRLENIDDFIFQNYKNDDKFKHYRVKEIRTKTLITLKGKITFRRRRYYKINPITEKEEYIFILDKFLGIKKWQRLGNDVKERILLFLSDDKKYRDILDALEQAKISLMTISNTIKNTTTNDKYYINNTNIKINVPHTLYIQVDGTFLKIEYDRKRIKKHTLLSTVHTGYDQEKSTEKRHIIANKLGVYEIDNIPIYISKKTKLTRFVVKLILLIISNYNIQDDTEIMILGDGANWIKGVKKDIANRFPNNKVHYTIDKFHLVKRFKDLLPHRRIIKENKETFKQVVDYFYNGKYYELLQCLKESKSFIPSSKKFLRETINLIKNNEEGIKNQTLWNNIGCHMEGDVSHYGKGAFSKKGIYSEKTVRNKLNTSMLKLRNNIKDFKQPEKPPENNSILYNNFNKTEQQNLHLY